MNPVQEAWRESCIYSHLLLFWWLLSLKVCICLSPFLLFFISTWCFLSSSLSWQRQGGWRPLQLSLEWLSHPTWLSRAHTVLIPSLATCTLWRCQKVFSNKDHFFFLFALECPVSSPPPPPGTTDTEDAKKYGWQYSLSVPHSTLTRWSVSLTRLL